jgi:hypothetical protein
MRSKVIVLILLAATTLTSLSAPDRSWFGTWRLNLTQSAFGEGSRENRVLPDRLELNATGPDSMSVRFLDASKMVLRAELDGKDYPVPGAPTPNTTVALRVVDAASFEMTTKAEGKVLLKVTFAITSSGQIMTVTGAAPGARFVYDRI